MKGRGQTSPRPGGWCKSLGTRALAEAAALLLVTKKMQALWGEAEED